MKVHYINMLLFVLPLNILVNTHKKSYITAHHTPKISITRLLCECDLYMPNYDNDPQMKSIMQQFEDRTSQRFHEYDDRMIKKRKQCKDKCDKEIQKIILKDKLEKQMEEQLTTLETKIDTDDIPTCICEKSIADKMEKGCLRCVGVFGGGVMPGFGTIGGTALYALNQLKPAVFKAAIKAALEEGAAEISAAGIEAGDAAGMKVVIHGLQHFRVDVLFPDIYHPFVAKNIYTEVTNIASTINSKYSTTCLSLNNNFTAPPACTDFQYNFGLFTKGSSTPGPPGSTAIPNALNRLFGEAEKTAEAAAKIAKKSVTTGITEKETVMLEAGFNNSITSIYASIIAIVVIVLILVIIYLILRYRRKKKMKKKLQYIKLLEE
ncbi:PIR protein, putative [Plasmodium sp. gorilla clade G1]|nr:PIR protein, putative [Plasmodium sp. gorilla clade G1]